MEVSTHHQHPDHQLKTSNLRKYDQIDSKTYFKVKLQIANEPPAGSKSCSRLGAARG